MFFDVLGSAPLAEATGVYYAFIHSDGVGQAIVIVLLIFSIVTWCVMLIKILGLKQGYQESLRILSEFRRRRNVLQMREVGMDEDAPVTMICKAGYRRMCDLRGSEDMLRRSSKPFNETEIQLVRSTLDEAIADEIIALQKKIIFLQTAVSISPFLGLFGTVWGIMLAFTAMAIAGKPDVQTLAPGVSGALLTTVLGLVVAIPSLIGYNIISEQVKNMTVVMDNFADEFINKLNFERVAAENGSQPAPQQTQYIGQQTQYQNIQQTYRQPVPQPSAPVQTYRQPVQQVQGYHQPIPAQQPQAQVYRQPVSQPSAPTYQQPVSQPSAPTYQQPVSQPSAPTYQQPSLQGNEPQPETEQY